MTPCHWPSRTVFVLALGFLGASTCRSQQGIPRTERALFDSANRERAARSLPLLKWDENLAKAARKHAELMAEQYLLLHQLPGEPDLPTRARAVGAGFSRITENIAMAEYAGSLHDGWMRSPGHRANILDDEVNAVGIAVVEGGEQLFAVEDFSQAVALLSLEQQEREVKRLISARGLHMVGVTNDARQACASESFGTGKAHYVARYETPDIGHLPEGLDKEVRSNRYKSAAVGACQRRTAPDAPPFRIAVLLY
jgi:Cysteine-rich secretory protein family